jgi:hypothetical protein
MSLWVIAQKQGVEMGKPRYRYWSTKASPTWKETDAVRFTSAMAARKYASRFQELAEWVVQPWKKST